MLGGFSLGIIVAVGVYVYGNSTNRSGALSPAQGSTAGQAASVAPATVPSATAPAAPPAQPLTAASTEAAQEETLFEFYDVLPEFEVVVPETAEALRRDVRADALERSGNYIVQAGSFRALADADRRQARIALLGMESHIQRVAIDDNVYHRVRIGPISDLAELNRVRRRLRDERIEYLLTTAPD